VCPSLDTFNHILGSEHPPAVQSFIEQETGESSPAEIRVEAPTIYVERDQPAYKLEEGSSTKPSQIERIPGMTFGTEFQRVPSISYYDESPIQRIPSQESQLNIQKANTPQIEAIPTPANILNFPSESATSSKVFIPKRKTMDGWLPIYGRRSLVRGTVSDLYHRPSAQDSSFPKGTYSPGKAVFNQNSLDTASSNTVPQVIPFIQVAAAQMMVPKVQQTITQQLQQHHIAQPQTLIPQFQSLIAHASALQPHENNVYAQSSLSESVIQPAQLLLSSQSQNVQQEQRTFPQPQIIPIVQPKLQFFTRDEVVQQGRSVAQPIFQNIAPQGGAPITQLSQMKDLFIENRTPQDGPVPKNVVIHAQNVIIGSHRQNESQAGGASSSSATASQIEEFGSTPQITAQLRQQFLVSKHPSHPLSGKPFPAGGLPLRSLAQALRNGAFSPDSNDIQSSYSGKQKNIMEITIPHTFKIKSQQTSASINQPVTHGGGYGGGPPKLSNHNKGQSDYGDSVKYKTPGEVGHIDIVDAQPIGEGGYNNNHGGGGGDGSLHHAAQDLKQRLVQMVMQELAATYGIPGKRPGAPLGQYGVPNAPGSNYGVPSGQYGAPGGGNHGPSNEYGPPGAGNHGPSEEYGPPSNDGHSGNYGGPSNGPSSEYGAPSEEYGAPAGAVTTVETSGHYDNHHLSPPPIPTTLAVDFDIGSTFPKGHGGHGGHGGGWGHGEEVTVVDAHAGPEGPTAKDQIAKLGKNLFWAALDFSRKYNPITFYEKVKEFPPIRFEVYDDHHGKDHKRKDKKKRRSEKDD